MKAMLLRVGIDKGTDGTLAPIFEDGSFEFIPISESVENSGESRTYGNTKVRSGKLLSEYVPKSICNYTMHFDPEFDTFTYGDPTLKRIFLLKLRKGDLLVFYAGLAPYKNNVYQIALYIIGYFLVDKVIDFNILSKEEIKEYFKVYSNNAHVKRGDDTEDLVIVVGNQNHSRLLKKAILISKTMPDKKDRPYQAVSNDMEKTAWYFWFNSKKYATEIYL